VEPAEGRTVPYSNPLTARWSTTPAFGLWCTTSNAAIAEYAASTGIHWIAWDLQHGLTSDEDLAGLFRSLLGTGVAPVVRVGANDPLLIGRALDVGAAGVIVPLVNTAEEAAGAVAACRFPPNGIRSFGPNRAWLVMGELDPRVIEDVACIVMVETAEGLANVEAIASTPGLDAILIGPSDLALGLGLDYDDRGERHQHAVKRILDACLANSIAAGIVLGDGGTARAHAELGFRFMSVATDLGLVLDGLTRELDAASAATATV
jgi:4-hydroxy-2-oxoheptanedioate aldolase